MHFCSCFHLRDSDDDNYIPSRKQIQSNCRNYVDHVLVIFSSSAAFSECSIQLKNLSSVHDLFSVILKLGDFPLFRLSSSWSTAHCRRSDIFRWAPAMFTCYYTYSITLKKKILFYVSCWQGGIFELVCRLSRSLDFQLI